MVDHPGTVTGQRPRRCHGCALCYCPAPVFFTGAAPGELLKSRIRQFPCIILAEFEHKFSLWSQAMIQQLISDEGASMPFVMNRYDCIFLPQGKSSTDTMLTALSYANRSCPFGILVTYSGARVLPDQYILRNRFPAVIQETVPMHRHCFPFRFFQLCCAVISAPSPSPVSGSASASSSAAASSVPWTVDARA